MSLEELKAQYKELKAKVTAQQRFVNDLNSKLNYLKKHPLPKNTEAHHKIFRQQQMKAVSKSVAKQSSILSVLKRNESSLKARIDKLTKKKKKNEPFIWT